MLGDWLSAARRQCGYSLEDLSQILRIQQFYLQGLEAEDRSSLPARPYVSGYVRSYALRVGLDPKEANQRLQHIWPLEEDAANTVKALRFPNAPRQRRFSGRGLTAAGLAVLVTGYAFWYFEAVRQQEPAAMSPVAELETGPPETPVVAQAPAVPPATPELGKVLGPLAPVNLQRLAPAQLEQLVHGGGEQAAREPAFKPLPAGPFPRPRPGTPPAVIWAKQYGTPSQAVDEPAEGGQAAAGSGRPGAPGSRAGGATSGSHLSAYLPKLQLRADLGPLNANVPAVATLARGQVPDGDAVLPEPVSHGRTQAFAAVPPNAGRDGEPVRAENRVVLSAEGAASWIEIRDSRGGVVFSRLLKAGQSMQVPNRRGLQLTTGNAGALVIWVDGVRLAAMGRDGAVVRGVSLDPDELLDRQG